MSLSIYPPFPSNIPENIKIKLASNSPRRRELLALIIPSFEIASKKNIDEVYPESLKATEVPMYLSQLKAKAYVDDMADDELIITADTVVISDEIILGKPKDSADAAKMLNMLSGKSHTVVTGVTLVAKDGRCIDTFSESTNVCFDDLSPEEIAKYVEIFSPLDKAGAYGIQEWIGCIGISKIEGCYYNVMGLPLHQLYRHLQSFYAEK